MQNNRAHQLEAANPRAADTVEPISSRLKGITLTVLLFELPPSSECLANSGILCKRTGRRVLIATYDRSLLTPTTGKLSSLTFIAGERQWTHMAVVVGDVRSNNDLGHSGWHEDPILQRQIERLIGLDVPFDPFELEGGSSKLVATTTTSGMAVEAMRLLLPADEVVRVMEGIQSVVSRVTSPYPILEDLGGARYFAITQKVQYQDRPAVLKMFRFGFEHHLATELRGLYAAHELMIGPEVLEVGPSWVVTEFLEGYHPVNARLGGIVTLADARAAFIALRRLHEKGLMHFDFSPSNVLRGRGGSVKLIDFEHLMPCRSPIPPFEHAPVFSGTGFFEWGDIQVSSDDVGRRRQYILSGPKATYATNWLPAVGLSFDLLYDRSIRAVVTRHAAVARIMSQKAIRRVRESVLKKS